MGAGRADRREAEIAGILATADKQGKVDVRVRYTQMVIRREFLRLLGEKELRKITVTDICKGAGINRATFYKHYQDVYDLLEHIEEGMLVRLREQVTGLDGGQSFHDAMVSILKGQNIYLQELAPIFGPGGDESFGLRITQECYDLYRDKLFASTQGGHPSEKEEMWARLRYAFIAEGSAGLIRRWLSEQMPFTEEEIADEIIRLVSATK